MERLRAFRLGLKSTGFTEGQNVAIEYRWAEGRNDRLPELTADLVRRQVAVIVVPTTPSVLAAKAATKTIPIVFFTAGDPIDLGLVTSLRRPDSNLTGATTLTLEVGQKLVQLLHEMVPNATSLALLINPTSPNLAKAQSSDLQTAAHSLGLQLHVLEASTDRDFDSALPWALAHYAVWIDGDDASDFGPEVKKRIEQMQEAVRVLENSLPIWQHLPFDVECPPAVKTMLEALPGLKEELGRLGRLGRRLGRQPDLQREVCATVIVEAWRLIHGKVEARSERLYEACNQYWTECVGAPLGDIENWRRTVERAIKSEWLRDPMAWISSKKWTDKKPHTDE